MDSSDYVKTLKVFVLLIGMKNWESWWLDYLTLFCTLIS